MTQNRALITGIGGQDGSFLAELLVEHGYEVTGIVHRPAAAYGENLAGVAGRVELVAPGGHLRFHDAVDTHGYGNHYPGVVRLMAEVERDDRDFERRPGAGSIAHFTRRS